MPMISQYKFRLGVHHEQPVRAVYSGPTGHPEPLHAVRLTPLPEVHWRGAFRSLSLRVNDLK